MNGEVQQCTDKILLKPLVDESIDMIYNDPSFGPLDT